MIFLVKKQKNVIRRFKRHAEDLMDPGGDFKRWSLRRDEDAMKPVESEATKARKEFKVKYDAWEEFKANADVLLDEVEQRLEELESLHRSAEEVSQDVSAVLCLIVSICALTLLSSPQIDQLLAMKQSQANVVQAWQAIRHGEEAVKQGRAIMIFTVMTIIFVSFHTLMMTIHDQLTELSNQAPSRLYGRRFRHEQRSHKE